MKIGDELIFDRIGFTSSTAKWNKLLVPINDAIDYFNSLKIDKANDDVFQKFASQKVDDIRKAYKEYINDQLKRAKLTLSAVVESSLKMADEQIDILQAKVDKMHQVRDSERLFIGADMQLDFENVSIVDGKAIISQINMEKIRKSFCTTIENENQLKFYSLVNKFKEDYNVIREFWNEYSSIPVDIFQFLINNDGMFIENNGKLIFNEALIEKIGEKIKEKAAIK